MTILVFLGVLLATVALGTPIAFAMLVTAVALMIHLDMFDAQIIAQNLINGADSFPLLAVPFFLLAGEVMNAGGLSRRIVNVAIAFVGHVRGGLGYVVIFASVLLASLSGSAVADSAALAALLVPMMARAGHDRARSCGLVAAGGIIAPVIPPSIGFVVFGVASGVSISRLFLAGIAPGVMMGLVLLLVWSWVSRKEDTQPLPRVGRRDRLHAMVEGSWALMLPVIIIVGLKMGVFTPTEAAVVAAVYSLLVATLVYRELKPKDILPVFVRAGVTTSVVMFLVAAAMVSAWLVTIADLPTQLIELMEPLMAHPKLLLLFIMLVIVAVGCMMDMTPAILILAPVLMPVVQEAGIDPVYFGVMFIINCSIGLITPPVGTVLNVVCGVGRVSFLALIKGIWPFLLAQLILLVSFVSFPELIMVPARWLNG